MTCTTHHHACECREAKFAELEDKTKALEEQVEDHQLLFKDYAAAQARIVVLREALDKVNKAYDKVSDGIQHDLENGVKWLNKQAAQKFNKEYPGVVKALDALLDASITADDVLAQPDDTTALDELLARQYAKGYADGQGA